MRVLVTGFNSGETSRQAVTMFFATHLPYVLNVMLPAGWSGHEGQRYTLHSVCFPDEQESVQDAGRTVPDLAAPVARLTTPQAAFVEALHGEPWTARRCNTVWMISTGLSASANALWTVMDAAFHPFEDLELGFRPVPSEGDR
ncbi:hypothetical protein [Deinococcus altitudinis]|uniref:hypothetical protein n=1 Tax=Deinococcus altitudinis TaxID=468914 RepID=UPI003891F743